MALRLKNDKKHTDKHGFEYSGLYMVIDDLSDNKREKRTSYTAYVYKDKASSDDDTVQPLLVLNCGADDGDPENLEWTAFFSPAAISNDDNMYAQAYTHFKQANHPAITISDWEDE